jgi:hypothetical protein
VTHHGKRAGSPIGQPNPTWQDDIKGFFCAPYWIDPAERVSTAQGWAGCMSGYGISLQDYESVKGWAKLIYEYLHSHTMPLGEAPWPDEPIETFRVWINQGCRSSAEDPVAPGEIIPAPAPEPVDLRIRRDLRSLSQEELDVYRACLDDALDIGNPDPAAPGQQFAEVHGDWCLHYQEAFIFWHRAYLMHFEKLIGHPVPYWNWYAEGASVDGNPAGGLPQAFKDETYVHPRTGETRPNPLRYAAAKAGVSKACAAGAKLGDQCRWVQRDPLLYTSGDDHRAEREAKIAEILKYQQQVQRALAFRNFSHPEGVGFPWANIQSFDPPPPDSEYIYRDYDFDGAYEQPHDNFHGWVGPDMADNSYTAYDPVFWSYHANIDRIFEIWLRANPAATYTAAFAIHPFSGPRATRLEFLDPNAFLYTTIGDLAKDSRALGYDFAPPVDRDFGTGPAAAAPGRVLRGGLAAAAVEELELLAIFDEVRCTRESFAIDVFIDQADAAQGDVGADNPHYVGRLSRIGMGREDTRGRCIRKGVPRILDATETAVRLGISSDTLPSLTVVVTDLATGAVVPQESYRDLPGFEGRLVWARRGWAGKTSPVEATVSSSCCSKAE